MKLSPISSLYRICSGVRTNKSTGIRWHQNVESVQHGNRLLQRIAFKRHHHQQAQVRFRRRLPIGVGTKQNDLLRFELMRDPLTELPNLRSAALGPVHCSSRFSRHWQITPLTRQLSLVQTRASAASAWGSQKVISMARYRSIAVVKAVRACAPRPV